ncbi:uncharacterized protein K441DRAFT_43777 [Cenococcum geophilum 1.58]|uniref:Uncharacterized protein n=1 Tax=Cenococcum geophilum 1.58 TaxID=794803 RepID=A0ACC8EK43_9PEZI|nr:hypothetical protein K441DRAFT_43777 [Cenococcum geophilum 1.58]
MSHYQCLTTCFHYLLPTVSAVFLLPFHVYIPLDFHRFTIKLLVQFLHTAKLTEMLTPLEMNSGSRSYQAQRLFGIPSRLEGSSRPLQ